MDKSSEILKEYELLRAEILQNLDIVHRHLSIIYAAIAAVFAFALANNNPYFLLPIYMMVLPVSAKTRMLNETNMRISSYMTVFLEPELPGVKWETHNHLRINSGKMKHHLTQSNKPITFLFLRANSANFLIGIFTFGAYLYCLYWGFSLSRLLICGSVNLFALSLLLYFLIVDYRYSYKRDAYMNEWELLKAELSQTETQV